MPHIGIGIKIQNSGVRYWTQRFPSLLTLTVISPTENQLDWTNNGGGTSHRIMILRSDDGGSYTELTNLAYTKDSFNDMTAVEGILYYYLIVYYIGSSFSALSNAVNNLTGDITTGLVGRWLLNEGSGTVATDTGGANNGTITGAEWSGDELVFDGVTTNDSVKLGDILDTTIAGENKKFTIAATVKPGVNNLTSNVIVGKLMDVSENQRQIIFRLSTDSKMSFVWYGALNGTAFKIVLGNTPVTNVDKFYSLAASYDGTNGVYDARVKLWNEAKAETITVPTTTGVPVTIPDGTAQLAIGACVTTNGTASKYNFNGVIKNVNIFNRILNYIDYLSLKYTGHSVPSLPTMINDYPLVYNYNAGQDDVFIDKLYADNYSGIAFRINKPTKYATNPVFGLDTDTWDRDKAYNTTLEIGGVYYMWYGAHSNDGTNHFYICRSTSTDKGLTWVKDNLGIVSYGGNTNNNIMIGDGSANPSVIYDESVAADQRYIFMLEAREGDEAAGGSCYIYKSADGLNLTLIKTLTRADSYYIEAKELVKRPDGRFLAYYVKNPLHGALVLRAVYAFLSDTTDPAGTWTDLGLLIDSSVITDQKYGMGIQYQDGVYYGFMSNYNKDTELTAMDLYTSRDGQLWSRKLTNWIPLGVSGAFDDSIIWFGKDLLKDGNNWKFFYDGGAENHAHAIPRDVKIGLATIGYKRIANIEGVGTFTTTAFTPTDILTINADLRKGTLKVELLLAADNSVIAGYSKDDMDVLSKVDTYSTEVKWGGNSIPTDTSLKIKFYLT